MDDEQQSGTQDHLFLYDQRDVEKLDRETHFLTDNNNFFPELVWKQIVRKLVKTQDIKSCSNSSPYFLKLLHNKRQNKVVLPTVFQKLFPYFLATKHEDNDATFQNLAGLAIVPEEDENVDENNEANDANINAEENQDQNNHHFENPAVLNMEEFSMTQLWNCRLVSKTWTAAIDAMFPDKETGHYTLKFDMTSCRNLQLDDWANDRFMAFDPPQIFTEHFDRTHYDFERNAPKKNPFLGRSAQFMQFHIINRMAHDFQEYVEGTLELLLKYGSELWYVFFDVHNGLLGHDPLVFYDLLRNFINLMPNLKVLRIMYTEDIPDDGGLDINVIRMVGLHQLEQAVQQSPLAILPHLEFLGTVNLPTPIFNELLKRNRHVEMLQADRKDFHGYYDIFREPFQNLKTLNLEFCSVEDFEQLESYQFPLELERVYFWYNNSAPFINWSRVINTLNSKLGKGCTELLLQMPLPKTKKGTDQVLEDSHVLRLDFPELEKLTIFDDSLFCLDFLLPTKNSLKFIIVRYSNDDDQNTVAEHLENQHLDVDRQTIEFVGFKETLEESNIWKEFPKLSDVTFHRNKAMGGCTTYVCSGGGTRGMEVEKLRWYRETR